MTPRHTFLVLGILSCLLAMAVAGTGFIPDRTGYLNPTLDGMMVQKALYFVGFLVFGGLCFVAAACYRQEKK